MSLPLIPGPVGADDRVQIVHAAGAVDPRELAAGIRLLVQAGLHVRHDPTIGSGGGDLPGPYLAASDELRLASVRDALQSSSVRALLNARGGWGSLRLLDELDPGPLREDPRWIAGYSDITALLVWAHAAGVASLHAPLVAGLPRYEDPASLQGLVAALRNQPLPLPPLTTLRPGVAEGRLIGGNLSVLASLIGTRWLPNLADCLLFVEEVGEPIYRIDRLFETLRVSGRARGLRGLVLGQFTRCGTPAQQAGLLATLRAIADRFEVPVVAGVPAGHGEPNLPLVMGIPWRLDASSALARLTPLMELGGRASVSALASLEKPPESSAERGPASAHPATVAFALRASLCPPASAGGVVALLQEAVTGGVASAVQVEVSRGAEVTHRLSLGATGLSSEVERVPVRPDTLMDLASLTKPLCTAILAMRLVERGQLSLEDRIPAELSASGATLGALLRHRAGVPAWLRWYEEARRADDPRAFLLRVLATVEPLPEQVGRCVYSDVGYLLLGLWLEHVTGLSLAEQFHRHVAVPLGLKVSGFGDGRTPLRSAAGVAATEFCPMRGRVLQGIVHDEHAQVMGGVAGHAGLFSTAHEVGVIVRSLLGHGPRILAPATVARMWGREEGHEPGTYVLGWDTPSLRGSTAGSRMRGASTVGHLGFTGTSVWVDRSRGVVAVLLTNRVHPTRDSAGIRELRPAFHDRVMEELGVEDDA